MNALTDVVKDLVINHRVSHKNIVKHVQKVVLDIGKDLPKVRVLYCASYGGYGLSKKFQSFVHSNAGDHVNLDSRVDLVQYIAPFGTHIMDQYVVLRRMIFLYYYYDIPTLVSCIRHVHGTTSEIGKIESDIKQFDAYIADESCQGTKELSNDNIMYYIYYNVEKGYTAHTYEKLRSSCIGVYNAKKEYLQTQKLKLQSNYRGTPETWAALYDDVERIVLQLQTDDKTHRVQAADRNKMDFMKAVDTLGEVDSSIWSTRYQRKMNEYSMRYLYIKYFEGEGDSVECYQHEGERTVYDFLLTKNNIEIPAEMYEGLREDVGLLCASTKYCDLKIAEVPQYVDWYIHEYDGSESVMLR